MKSFFYNTQYDKLRSDLAILINNCSFSDENPKLNLQILFEFMATYCNSMIMQDIFKLYLNSSERNKSSKSLNRPQITEYGASLDLYVSKPVNSNHSRNLSWN